MDDKESFMFNRTIIIHFLEFFEKKGSSFIVVSLTISFFGIFDVHYASHLKMAYFHGEQSVLRMFICRDT